MTGVYGYVVVVDWGVWGVENGLAWVRLAINDIDRGERGGGGAEGVIAVVVVVVFLVMVCEIVLNGFDLGTTISKGYVNWTKNNGRR